MFFMSSSVSPWFQKPIIELRKPLNFCHKKINKINISFLWRYHQQIFQFWSLKSIFSVNFMVVRLLLRNEDILNLKQKILFFFFSIFLETKIFSPSWNNTEKGQNNVYCWLIFFFFQIENILIFSISQPKNAQAIHFFFNRGGKNKFLKKKLHVFKWAEKIMLITFHILNNSL